MAAAFSKAENQFRKVMGVLAVAFFIGAVLFAMVPDTIVNIVNWIGGLFDDRSVAPVISKISVTNYMDTFYPKVEGLDPGAKLPSHGMYVSLAVAFMILVTYFSALVYRDPRKHAAAATYVIIGKFATSLTGLGLYLFSYSYFANLVVFITDFPIALVVLIFFLRARRGAAAAIQEAAMPAKPVTEPFPAATPTPVAAPTSVATLTPTAAPTPAGGPTPGEVK